MFVMFEEVLNFCSAEAAVYQFERQISLYYSVY